MSGSLRLFVIGLVAMTTMLAIASVAEGWRRPAADSISSSEGGVYRACRDGITFQVANSVGGTQRFIVWSPPRSTVVAQGEITLEPVDPLQVDSDGQSFLGTKTVRWAGGRLLEPGPNAVEIGVYELSSPHGAEPDVIEDCFLFPPVNKRQCTKKQGWRRWGFKNRGRCIEYLKQRVVDACVAERDAGEAEFREKYGTGKQHRHALRNCIRETT